MPKIVTARDAEQNAATRMRELGFEDAVVTADGPDGGIDVRSRAAVAQVKCWYRTVGTPELQRLFGARGNDRHLKMLFFARAGYARGATSYADEHEIALFTFDDTGAICPQNTHARSLTTKPNARPRPSTNRRGPDDQDPPYYVRQRRFFEVGCQIAESRMRELGFSSGKMVMGSGPGLYTVMFVDHAIAGIRVTRGAVGRFTLQDLSGVQPRGSRWYGDSLPEPEQRFYFSCDGYMDDAIAYADSVRMALFTYGRAATTFPSNRHAHDLVNRRTAR